MKTPSEHDAVAFLKFLRNEADSTMDSRKHRTPFDAVYAGVANADDTVGMAGWLTSYPRHEEWCRIAIESIRTNCCSSEPEEICQWLKERGLTY